ncbi:DUF5983 family protein [Marinobacter salsuginis]|uniref:DUF5983 domain-containing protein n=1 Tax=Marinobacter salsuginis TaxID=418719 RepID=A0A5M3Q1V7_9GAMM|nr:hypothetical protein [Marinobacter salsuginis]GBO89163.1 hypothetical protein MSSD14B_28310 [Marinobacter salsuginis]
MSGIVLPDPKGIETYSAVAMSTGHLAPADFKLLDRMVDTQESTRILKRPYGYFIKLAGDAHRVEHDLIHQASDALNRIIVWAKAAGFSLIEFDSDAGYIDGFTVFEEA